MSERIDLAEIRAGAEQHGDSDALFFCPDVLALVDAVRVAKAYAHGRASITTLRIALARFDFESVSVEGHEVG